MRRILLQAARRPRFSNEACSCKTLAALLRDFKTDVYLFSNAGLSARFVLAVDARTVEYKDKAWGSSLVSNLYGCARL